MEKAEVSWNNQIPVSRFKRSHRKSRLGCQVCKARHIKCDETKPGCIRCRNRRLTCTYDERAHSSSAESDVSTTPASGHSPVVDAPLALEAHQYAEYPVELDQSQLIQHFFAHTLRTLIQSSDRDATASFWRVVVPSLAYTSSSVRHGVSAIAALCSYFDAKAINEPTSKYFQAAAYHGPLAIKQLGQQLEDMKPSNVDYSLTCSRILGLVGLAFFRIRRSNGQTLRDPEAWIWLQMLRGVIDVQQTIIGLGMGMEIDQLILKDMKPEVLPSPGAHVNKRQDHTHQLLHFVARSRSKRLQALYDGLNEHESNYTHEESSTLLSAISELEIVTEHICGGNVQSMFRAMCTWPSNVSPDFVLMLRRNEPFSLSIYAHWLMLVILVEDYWWIGDMGRAGLSEIVEICSETWIAESNLLYWAHQILEIPCAAMDSLTLQ